MTSVTLHITGCGPLETNESVENPLYIVKYLTNKDGRYKDNENVCPVIRLYREQSLDAFRKLPYDSVRPNFTMWCYNLP